MSQRWFRALFRRRVIVILLLVLQVVFWVHLVSSVSQISRLLSKGLTILSLLAALYIVSKKDKGAYKTTWIFLILSLPLFGGLLYLLFSFQNSTRRFAKNIRSVEVKAATLFYLPGDDFSEAEKQLGCLFPQVRYLQDYTGFSIYSSSIKYFKKAEFVKKIKLTNSAFLISSEKFLVISAIYSL